MLELDPRTGEQAAVLRMTGAARWLVASYLELRRAAGPLVTRARIEHGDLLGIELRALDGALVANTMRKPIVLSNLGSRAERTRLRDALCSVLGLGDHHLDGGEEVVPPRSQAIGREPHGYPRRRLRCGP